MPSKKSVVPATVNPDLQKERDAASFEVEEFKQWFYGGADKLRDKQEIEKFLLKDQDPTFKHHYLSWENYYALTLKYTAEGSQLMRECQQQRNPGGMEIWPLLYTNGTAAQALAPTHNPFATHITMFVDFILNQGTEEQIEKFGKPGANCNIVGTYAQTELAHGTNVRAIQTRADFDRETDEFVLNTPNMEAYKFWPGGLGHTANHALVVAQLYIDGQHKGIQMFVVPIRDRETHLPLPGVDVGEVGKKVGMLGTNQGFLGLKQVRIPRGNMLSKYVKVDRDGKFTESPASRLNYMTMVYTRCLMVNLMAAYLLEATTIATRYSAVRRQSPINPNEREPQILDHVTQQLKLFPEIATGISLILAGKHMWTLYDKTWEEIHMGEFGRLQEIHIISSALKVLSTTESSFGIERLRQACGGHGYLSAANFNTIFGDAVAAYTYEGENTVLLLQIGRFLMKTLLREQEGKPLPAFVQYLALSKKPFGKWNDSWEGLVNALQFAAGHKARVAFDSFSKRMAEGKTLGEASNLTGIEMTKAAEFFNYQFAASTFLNYINTTKTERSASLNKVMENILELYLVQTSLRFMSDILRFIPLTDAELRSLERRLEAVLKKLRPDAVAICDGFDFHDRALNSVLGSYDGNVYERIYESALESPLNQKPVSEAFHKYLKPFFKSNM